MKRGKGRRKEEKKGRRGGKLKNKERQNENRGKKSVY